MFGVILQKSKAKGRKILGLSITYSLLLASAILYTASVYKRKQFGDSQLDEIIFYMTNGLADGQALSFVEAARDNLLLCGILFFLLLLPVIDFYRNRVRININLEIFGNNRRLKFNPSHMPIRYKLSYAIVVFLISLWVLMSSFHAVEYIRSLTQVSDVYEKNYVDPKKVALKFPEKKRNLVYIYMESMENTVVSRSHGGRAEVSRIPELESIALDKKNVSFSNLDSGLGGALPVSGTTWTVAGMVAQSTGVPLKHSLFNTDNGSLDRSYKEFLPGAGSLGQLLEREGYNQSFLMGSVASFGGRDSMLKQHGNYNVLDYEKMKANGSLPKDYGVWWGYEDKKLFEFSKKEATRLASEGKPFNLQMLTADTHFTDGYLDSSCQARFTGKYDNVHACSSAMVAELVQWLKEQPFGDNTTIVLTGDHLGMQAPYYEDLIADSQYQRTIYNAIINSAIAPIKSNSRTFSTLDMYPTTLAAMGVTIPGDKLGLGVNLFSEQPTLLEKYGSIESLSTELEKRSNYYEDNILRVK